MSSLRHEPDPRRSARDGYLDAARDCILDVGWRRTTLTEVARRAGVSRMTIYRAWSDMPQLLGDLMTREWGVVVAGTLARQDLPATRSPPSPGGSSTPSPGCATTSCSSASSSSTPSCCSPTCSPVVAAASRPSSSCSATGIEAGQRTGEIRAGSADTLARTLLLTSHGFVFSAHTMVDDDVSEADLDAELAPPRGAGAASHEPASSPPVWPVCPTRSDLVVIGLGATGRRDRAGRGHPRALRAGRRRARPGVRHLAVVLQARPRRPALPRPGAVRRGARERRRARAADGGDRTAPDPRDAVGAAAHHRRLAPARDDDGLRASSPATCCGISAHTRRATLPRPRRISATETLQHAPGLRSAGLRGGLLSWDGQLEDDARLVTTIARTAARHGAHVRTRVAGAARHRHPGDPARRADRRQPHRERPRRSSTPPGSGPAAWSPR